MKIPAWSTALSTVAVALALCIVFVPDLRTKAMGQVLLVLLTVTWVPELISDYKAGLFKLPVAEAARLAPPFRSLPSTLAWLAAMGGGPVAIWMMVAGRG